MLPPHVVKVPRKYRSRFETLMREAQRLAQILNLEMAVTSFFRGDGTAHRFGIAMDLAPRSGAGFRKVRNGTCPYYYANPAFVRRVMQAAATLSQAGTAMGRICIEADHLHVELARRGSRGIRVSIFAPELNNELCQLSQDESAGQFGLMEIGSMKDAVKASSLYELALQRAGASNEQGGPDEEAGPFDELHEPTIGVGGDEDGGDDDEFGGDEDGGFEDGGDEEGGKKKKKKKRGWFSKKKKKKKKSCACPPASAGQQTGVASIACGDRLAPLANGMPFMVLPGDASFTITDKPIRLEERMPLEYFRHMMLLASMESSNPPIQNEVPTALGAYSIPLNAPVGAVAYAACIVLDFKPTFTGTVSGATISINFEGTYRDGTALTTDMDGLTFFLPSITNPVRVYFTPWKLTRNQPIGQQIRLANGYNTGLFPTAGTQANDSGGNVEAPVVITAPSVVQALTISGIAPSNLNVRAAVVTTVSPEYADLMARTRLAL